MNANWWTTQSVPIRPEWWEEGAKIWFSVSPLEVVIFTAALLFFAGAFASWCWGRWKGPIQIGG